METDDRYSQESCKAIGARVTANLQAVAKRDRRAFEAVYEATVDRVLSLATRITGDADLADDVASEVYLQIWRQADRFDPARGSAIAWIMTIGRSRALDFLRRRSTTAEKTATFEQQSGSNDSLDTLHDLLLATDQASSVHHALTQLTADERQLLALAYFRGYSHSELAAMTGQPLGTVKTRIRRALIKMRELMLDDSMDAGETT